MGKQSKPSYFSMATRNSKEHGISLEEQARSINEDGELYATIMATRKPNPRGPGYIRLYALVAVVLLCSTMNGFDSSLMGSINTLPNYIDYFGLPASGNASTGIVFAIFQVCKVWPDENCHTTRLANHYLKVGQMVGALFIWMADWYGRTWHMFFGCLGVCLATIVTALSINLPMLIAGRFFLSFFATCAHTAAPLYLVEITPAAYRGTLAGLYNTFYNVVSMAVLLASEGNED